MQPRELWERYMGCYDYLTGVGSYLANLREIVAATALQPGSRVLDAGSGTGNLSLLLKELGAHVVSCDFSESALACHRKKDPQAELVQASLEERLPFRDVFLHRQSVKRGTDGGPETLEFSITLTYRGRDS